MRYEYSTNYLKHPEIHKDLSETPYDNVVYDTYRYISGSHSPTAQDADEEDEHEPGSPTAHHRPPAEGLPEDDSHWVNFSEQEFQELEKTIHPGDEFRAWSVRVGSVGNVQQCQRAVALV